MNSDECVSVWLCLSSYLHWHLNIAGQQCDKLLELLVGTSPAMLRERESQTYDSGNSNSSSSRS